MTALELLPKAFDDDNIAEKLASMEDAEIRELRGDISGIAQRAAYWAAYIERRRLAIANQTHKESKQHARKVVKKVRTALGYTYP